MSVLTTRGMRGSIVYHTGNGFHYYCSSTDSSRMYMKCVRKQCGGRATMSTETRLAIDFRPTCPHHHGPDFTFIPKLETRRRIMWRCRNEDATLRNIFDDECSRVPADVSSQLNYKELKPSMNRERTARVREDTLQVAINEGLINNTRTATDVSLDPLLQLKERILVRCRTEDTSVKHIFQDECSRVPFELSSLLTYKALKPLMNNERASRLRDNYQQAAISEGNGSHNEAAHPYDVLPSGGSVQDAASCADDPLATKEESTLPPEMYNVHPEEPPILPPQPKKFKPLSQTDPTNSLPQTVGSQGRHSKFQDASLDSHHFTGQSQEYPHNVHIKSEYDYEDDSVDISSVDNSGAASNTMSEPMVEEPHRTADKRAAEEQDDHDRYGVYVASKLRKMDPVQCVFAENLINQALFKGAINSLREDTTFFNPSSR